MICIRTEEPDYSALPTVEYEWAHSVYRTITELQREDWPTPRGKYSKKQGTVKTATFGSKFAAPQTCTEQIIDLQDILRYMGVPIREKSYTFGDNKTVVNSSNTMYGDKISTSLTLDSLYKIRADARSNAQICFLS